METANRAGGLAIDQECDCCSAELDLLHGMVIESDRLVAKALVIPEVASIANLEYRMQQLLIAKWDNRSRQAIARASSMATSGRRASEIANAVESVMGQWAGDVSKPYAADIARMYKLARDAGWKKATGRSKASLQYNPSALNKLDTSDANRPVDHPVSKADKPKGRLLPKLDLLDAKAVEGLSEKQMFWIGEVYGTNVSATVREATAATMSAGLGRTQAGAEMSKAVSEALGTFSAPAGYRGPAKRYFEGLAANTATVTRAYGQLRSFSEIGVTRYQLVNPMDHRTSELCQALNGKIFTVADGMSQMAREMAAKNPEDIKRLHPWLDINGLKSIMSAGPRASEAARMAAAGLALPPYHFRCRTTVDVL